MAFIAWVKLCDKWGGYFCVWLFASFAFCASGQFPWPTNGFPLTGKALLDTNPQPMMLFSNIGLAWGRSISPGIESYLVYQTTNIPYAWQMTDVFPDDQTNCTLPYHADWRMALYTVQALNSNGVASKLPVYGQFNTN
jgi:hypothetical protein